MSTVSGSNTSAGSWSLSNQGTAGSSRLAIGADGGYVGATERVSIMAEGATAGNVGIGTTSPATKLQVDASGHALVVSNDTGNRRIYFGTGTLGEPDIQATLSNGTARELSINAAGGNVGIGVLAQHKNSTSLATSE